MQEYKGMRLFPPVKHRQLSGVLEAWVAAAETRGFEQYKTPLIDPIELYTGKTSEEIINEQTFRFTDRGGREVLLRPEITPGAGAMVASMQKSRDLPVPFKGFSIGSVFRYEKPQKGRTREHIQFNADIFGADGAWADAEVIEVIFDALERMGLEKKNFVVRVNDRNAISSSLLAEGVSEAKLEDTLRMLDRRDKMEDAVFEKKLHAAADISVGAVDRILRREPKSVTELISILPDDISAEYSPGIVRGFDYYTGIVFEVYAKDAELASRSIAGGGRYDNLVESYGGKPLSAVGFGMGDTALLNCLEVFDIPVPKRKTVIAVCTAENALESYTKYRAARHNNSMFIGTVNGKKMADTYKRCQKSGFEYVVCIEKNGVAVRDLLTRETKKEKTLSGALEKIGDAPSENTDFFSKIISFFRQQK